MSKRGSRVRYDSFTCVLLDQQLTGNRKPSHHFVSMEELISRQLERRYKLGFLPLLSDTMLCVNDVRKVSLKQQILFSLWIHLCNIFLNNLWVSQLSEKCLKWPTNRTPVNSQSCYWSTVSALAKISCFLNGPWLSKYYFSSSSRSDQVNSPVTILLKIIKNQSVIVDWC